MGKIKLFDKNIFLEDLRQLKTVNVICGVILLLEAVLVPLYAFIVRPDPDQVYYSSANTVPLYAVGPLVLCVALAMPVMTNNLFDFIDKRNASDFYHSLPVRRETMYITHIVVVLLSCLALFIIPSVVEYVLFLPISYMNITLENLGYVLADVMVLGLLLSSVVVVAKCLCGTRFGVMAVFVMILVLPRCYLLFIRSCIEGFYPYLLLGENNNIFWNMKWNLLFGIFSDYTSIGSIIYTLILSLIYFVLGGALFIKRKSEKAESVAVNKHVQLVFRLLPALTFSFLPIIGMLECVHEDTLSAENLCMIFILYIVAIVIYFLYELLTTKKLKSVVKAAPGLIFLLAGNILIVGIIEGYAYGQTRISPTADEIISVEFIDDAGSYSSRTGVFQYSNAFYYDEMLDGIKFTDKEIVSLIAEGLDGSPELVKNSSYYWSNDVYVKIKYNGGTIYRRIFFEDDCFDELVDAVVVSDEFYAVADMLPDLNNTDISYYRAQACYEAWYSNTTSKADLSDEEFLKVYESYKNELGTLDKSEQYKIAALGSGYEVYLSFGLMDSRFDSTYSFDLCIDEELMPETYSLVEKYLNITYDEPDLDEEV